MRMWNINPRKMCDQHLVGEHYEIHMFFGVISKGKNIKGYIDKGLVEVHNIKSRHDILVKEMLRRNMKHHSPMLQEIQCSAPIGSINKAENEIILYNKCISCHQRMDAVNEKDKLEKI